MKFLIDECLSMDLVLIASAAGYEAQHVVRIGKAGWKDWNVARYASDGDYVFLVTNNAVGFRRLYEASSLHAGLVILIPNVGRQSRCQLFEAIAELAAFGESINKVLEADIDGDDMVFTLYDLPDAPL